MQKIRNNQGFTLIELMIVVVIIGILAAIAIPRFTSVSAQAKQAEAGPILKQMCTLAEAEFLKTGTWEGMTHDALPGWEAPDESYFDFELAGQTASATTSENGLVEQNMDCLTKEITDVEAAATTP